MHQYFIVQNDRDKAEFEPTHAEQSKKSGFLIIRLFAIKGPGRSCEVILASFLASLFANEILLAEKGELIS